MSIATVRTNLKLALEGVKGLHPDTVYKEPPSSMSAFPAAIIDFAKDAANYVEPGTGVEWHFKILLLLAEFDPDTAYESLDDYLERSGDYSIKQKVDAYAVADYAWVKTADNVGLISYRGSNFIGAEFTVEVFDTL